MSEINIGGIHGDGNINNIGENKIEGGQSITNIGERASNPSEVFDEIAKSLRDKETSWDDVALNIDAGDSLHVDAMREEFDTPADFVDATSMAVQDYSTKYGAGQIDEIVTPGTDDFSAEEKTWTDRWKAISPTLAKGGITVAKAVLSAAVPTAGPVISGALAGLQFVDGLLK